MNSKGITVLYRDGLLDDEACKFSMEAEVENSNIVKGYFSNDFIYKVYCNANKTLVDKETGLNFSIVVNKNDFSILKNIENKNNIDKLFQQRDI